MITLKNSSTRQPLKQFHTANLTGNVADYEEAVIEMEEALKQIEAKFANAAATPETAAKTDLAVKESLQICLDTFKYIHDTHIHDLNHNMDILRGEVNQALAHQEILNDRILEEEAFMKHHVREAEDLGIIAMMSEYEDKLQNTAANAEEENAEEANAEEEDNHE